MKYRYLIVDEDGDVTGTNDQALAKLAAQADYNVVVDVANGAELKAAGNLVTLDEADPDDFEGPEADSDGDFEEDPDDSEDD